MEMVKIDIGRQWERGNRIQLWSRTSSNIPSSASETTFRPTSSRRSTKSARSMGPTLTSPSTPSGSRTRSKSCADWSPRRTVHPRSLPPRPPAGSTPRPRCLPFENEHRLARAIRPLSHPARLWARAAWARSTSRPDTQLDRHVALKVPPLRRPTAPRSAQRFYREARAAGHARPPEHLPGLRCRRDRRHALPDDGLHRGPVRSTTAIRADGPMAAAAGRRRSCASWPWRLQEAH